MTKLMKASLWCKREFDEGSQPDNRTVKKWINNGLIKGRIIDGAAYVFSSERWGVPTEISNHVLQLISES